MLSLLNLVRFSIHLNHLLVIFETLTIRKDSLHPNTSYMIIFVFAIVFHVFIVCCCISMDCMACYHSNTVLISVVNSYSIYVFFKHACHTPLAAEGK